MLAISKEKRTYLLQWMLQLQKACKMSEDTYHSTVLIFDKLIEMASLTNCMPFFLQKPEQTAITVLFLCSKLLDLYYPYYDKYFELCQKSYSYKNQVMQPFDLVLMECHILQRLKCALVQPHALRFYHRFARAAGYQEPADEYFLGQYLIAISVMYPNIQFSHPQSKIAASAVYLVNRIMERQKYWTMYLTEITGYQERELLDCSKHIIFKYMGLLNNKEKYKVRLEPVKRKYSKSEYCKVAYIRPAKK